MYEVGPVTLAPPPPTLTAQNYFIIVNGSPLPTYLRALHVTHETRISCHFFYHVKLGAHVRGGGGRGGTSDYIKGAVQRDGSD
jgi:hypothetical protein